MRLPKLLIVLIGIAATGPALAGSPEDAAGAPAVVVLRGSSAPPTSSYAPPPPSQVAGPEVASQPPYYLPPYYLPPYYYPTYYLALPFATIRQQPKNTAIAPAAVPHRK